MNGTLLKLRHPDFMPIPLQTNVPVDMVELGLWVKKPKFHSLVGVALGCRVMLTKNLDIGKGGCNGAEGTVVGLKLYPDGVLKAVVIELDTGVVIPVYRSEIKYKYLNGIRYRKATFPLMLCYAITGHKCQGATITGRVVLLIREVFCPGLLYVMLSRVLDRKQLCIVGRLTTKMFVPVPQKFLN
jgi:ATP-dependent exoDNAse (exonuclease V) alpha subunit